MAKRALHTQQTDGNAQNVIEGRNPVMASMIVVMGEVS